jgi:hypothetical protein
MGIARHPRSYGQDVLSPASDRLNAVMGIKPPFDQLHYLAPIETKASALDQVATLQGEEGWQCRRDQLSRVGERALQGDGISPIATRSSSAIGAAPIRPDRRRSQAGRLPSPRSQRGLPPDPFAQDKSG